MQCIAISTMALLGGCKKSTDPSLVIETERASPILRVDRFHLILKSANGFGGIAAMNVPAAQLGASFLQLFETVIFDPRSGAVWLKV